MRLNDLINQHIGHYRVEALLGRGGMAAVYRAFDTRLHRHVALKVLYPHYVADPDIIERFRREAITAAQLDHPHIAPIYDVGEADGIHFLTMKLLPGPSLADALQREGRLAPARAVALAYEVAAALDEAHARGIVHRDIKPGNVLFDDRGRAVLTDFGIAKSLDAPALTESSVIVGTPDYIAPEQIDPRLASDGKIDRRADLYSLGALLYRALTGRRPYDGSSQAVLVAHLRDEPPPPSSIVPALPPALDRVIAKAMAKRPDDRYSTASELAEALADSLGDQTEVGAIFPPTSLRRDPHTRSTTQVAPPAAIAAPVAPPLEAGVQTFVQPRRRRLVASIVVTALLLAAALLLPEARAMVAGWFGAGDPSTAIAAAPSAVALPSQTPPGASETATPTGTTPPTTTTSPTVTATSAPSSTATTTATPTGAPPSPTTAPTIAPQPVSGQRPTSRPAPTTAPRPTQPPVQPTRAPTPQPTAAPTTPPTPQPTATDAPAPCQIALVGGFGELWRSNKRVQDALGCPASRERAGNSVEQLFEGGLMYYRQETEQIWVFSAEIGTWRDYSDVALSDPEPNEQAPNGLITPKNGFGRVWQKYPTVRQNLGWATTPETPFTGVIEPFDRGMMLWVPAVNSHGARIYVMYNTGKYEMFRDDYTGP